MESLAGRFTFDNPGNGRAPSMSLLKGQIAAQVSTEY